MELNEDFVEEHSDPMSASEAEESEDETDIEESDTEEENERENVYSRNNFIPPECEFEEATQKIRPEFGVDVTSSKLDILRKFLTEDIIESIVTETNRYAEQMSRLTPLSWKKWTPIDSTQLWRFLSVCFLMGIVKKPAIRDYWSTNSLLHTPAITKIMSRDRFLEILRAFHLNDNESVPQNNTDRFVKLGTFMTNLLQNFKSAINPSEYLCIDETLLAFKGRLSFLQYNPKKRARFGIKQFLLCDCHLQFVLDILPYQGKATNILNRNWIKDYGFGGSAVLSLIQEYAQKCHKVILDNWFMSPKLVVKLKEMAIFVLGTCQKRRKEMPRMNGKLTKGQVEIFSNENFLVERWMDRREVVMVNSFIDHSMETPDSANPNNTREKPRSVLIYNATMGGVDAVDKTVKPYQSVRKTYKWYKKCFFNLLDISIYNSFVLHCHVNQKPRKDYKEFLLSLVQEILDTFPKPQTSNPTSLIMSCERTSGTHLPMKRLNSEGKARNGDCFYCKKITKTRRTTPYQCKRCNKLLCIQGENSCFYKYHTARNLRDCDGIRVNLGFTDQNVSQ